jgi:ribonuclease G
VDDDLKKMIVNYASREKRYALVINNKVEKIVIDRPEHQSLVGNIYYGTVTKVLPGMNAVFIDIGEEKNAYLHRDLLAKFVLSEEEKVIKEGTSITKFVHQGEKIMVQVNKDATGTKGPRVTGINEIQGHNLIYMPNGRYVAVSKKIIEENSKSLRRLGTRMKEEEEGIIFRTASIGATEDELLDELNELRLQFKEMVRKAESYKKPGLLFQKETFVEMITKTMEGLKNGEVILDDLGLKQKLESNGIAKKGNVKLTYFHQKENIFSAHRVEHEIEKALKRVVWLENGSYLIFDETEALTIIDVNTGKFSGKIDLQDTVLKTNLLAASEITRQLRLRDIGGMILVDFIDMKREKDRSTILETMDKELKRDEKRTKVIGFTPLGILQLTRKKTRITLSEALQDKCPECAGTGRVESAETVAFRLERELFEHRHSEFEAVLIETTKEVKEVFEGPNKMYQTHFEEAANLKIYFSIQLKTVPYYHVKQFGNASEIRSKMNGLY